MKLSDRSKAQMLRIARHAAVYLLLTCLAYVIVYPLFGRIMYSFMTEADLNDDTVHLFTKHFTLDNYRQAIDYMQYGTGLVKSLVSLVFYSLLQVGVGDADRLWSGTLPLSWPQPLVRDNHSDVDHPAADSVDAAVLPVPFFQPVWAAGGRGVAAEYAAAPGAAVRDGSGAEKRAADFYAAAVFPGIPERTGGGRFDRWGGTRPDVLAGGGSERADDAGDGIPVLAGMAMDGRFLSFGV